LVFKTFLREDIGHQSGLLRAPDQSSNVTRCSNASLSSLMHQMINSKHEDDDLVRERFFRPASKVDPFSAFEWQKFVEASFDILAATIQRSGRRSEHGISLELITRHDDS